MNNGQIYDFVVTMLRKNKEGSFVNAGRFTTVLIQKMWEKINFEITRYEKSQIVTEALRLIKHENETIAVDGNGLFDLTALPSDYPYLFRSALRYDNSGDIRKITVVTDEEWDDAMQSSVMIPNARYPICKFVGNKIHFSPIVSKNVTFDYLFKPDEPYYDYYVNSDDEQVYLPEGSEYTLGTGETYTRKDTGVVMTHGQIITASINQSKELPFPEGERQSVVMSILSSFGVPLSDQLTVQYAQYKEQQENLI